MEPEAVLGTDIRIFSFLVGLAFIRLLLADAASMRDCWSVIIRAGFARSAVESTGVELPCFAGTAWR